MLQCNNCPKRENNSKRGFHCSLTSSRLRSHLCCFTAKEMFPNTKLISIAAVLIIIDKGVIYLFTHECEHEHVVTRAGILN